MDQTLEIEWTEVDRLFVSPSNPRHNDAAVPHVAASLRRFGWRQPIVARRSGEVIAGNTRLRSAIELGMDKVPVVWFDGSDLDATAYAIADNRTGEFAEWDEPALAKLLDELRSEDSLDGIGYSTDDIDVLLAELEEVNTDTAENPIDDPGAEDPPENPTARPGDLWLLGDHRLLCGDSTNRDDVERVMAGEKAQLVATDPPYCIDYTGERPNDSGKDWTDTYREIDIKDPEGFFRSVFTNVLHVLAPHAAIYAWHAHKRQSMLASIWDELDILNHQQIVWVKPTPVFGRVFWHFRHEPCVMGWRRGSMPEHDGNHEASSVWEVDFEGKARVVDNEHPTQKPLELFLRPMRKHTKRGDICFEPFSGSGSQLIAAEQLGRRCFALELAPAYVDVAIRRWEKATGQEATLDGDERSFAEMNVERGSS